MPKTTAKNVETSTDDAARQAGLVTLVREHRAAIEIGMQLRMERDKRNQQAVSLMSHADAMEKLSAIVRYLDDAVYSNCDDIRQASAHAICTYTLIPALARGVAAEQGTPEYAAALSDVLAGIALLVQRGPSSVRGQAELTFALQGYVSMLRGMRGVELDISHTTTVPGKLAAIRAQQDKREQRMADAVNNVRALLAPVVDADK